MLFIFSRWSICSPQWTSLKKAAVYFGLVCDNNKWFINYICRFCVCIPLHFQFWNIVKNLWSSTFIQVYLEFMPSRIFKARITWIFTSWNWWGCWMGSTWASCDLKPCLGGQNFHLSNPCSFLWSRGPVKGAIRKSRSVQPIPDNKDGHVFFKAMFSIFNFICWCWCT